MAGRRSQKLSQQRQNVMSPRPLRHPSSKFPTRSGSRPTGWVACHSSTRSASGPIGWGSMSLAPRGPGSPRTRSPGLQPRGRSATRRLPMSRYVFEVELTPSRHCDFSFQLGDPLNASTSDFHWNAEQGSDRVYPEGLATWQLRVRPRPWSFAPGVRMQPEARGRGRLANVVP